MFLSAFEGLVGGATAPYLDACPIFSQRGCGEGGVRTAAVCAAMVSETWEAPMSKTWMLPSLVPTMACLLPGANSAHSPWTFAPGVTGIPDHMIDSWHCISRCLHSCERCSYTKVHVPYDLVQGKLDTSSYGIPR